MKTEINYSIDSSSLLDELNLKSQSNYITVKSISIKDQDTNRMYPYNLFVQEYNKKLNIIDNIHLEQIKSFPLQDERFYLLLFLLSIFFILPFPLLLLQSIKSVTILIKSIKVIKSNREKLSFPFSNMVLGTNMRGGYEYYEIKDRCDKIYDETEEIIDSLELEALISKGKFEFLIYSKTFANYYLDGLSNAITMIITIIFLLFLSAFIITLYILLLNTFIKN